MSLTKITSIRNRFLKVRRNNDEDSKTFLNDVNITNAVAFVHAVTCRFVAAATLTPPDAVDNRL